MSFYIIAIGGTGAKCVEAVTQASAIGLFTEEVIKVLFIDADETNGNLERARNSLSLYQRCYDFILGDKQQLGWMKTPIQSFDLWSPFTNKNINKNLASFFSYNTLKQNNEALGNLFDVLYTKDELEADLDVGFRGRPAIGSAVMSRVNLDDLDHEPWGTIISHIEKDVSSGKYPKILLCGSMFGGTGASGLPTIGRLIANKLERENVRGRVKIGCLFVLPYFGFSPKAGNNPEQVYARADQFLLNTEAALRYYVNQAKQFDTVYLLGNQNFSQYEFSIGKKTQRNEPHFIELYTALAARHFWLNTPAKPGAVVLISRQNKSRLFWNDLPDHDVVKSSLVNATRFAYLWLTDIVPELVKARDMGVNKFQRVAPWFSKFFGSGQDGISSFLPRTQNLPDFSESKQQDGIKIIASWCKDYLRWLNDIHSCEGDDIQLFDLSTDELSKLIIGDQRDRSTKAQDNPQRLKEALLDTRNIPFFNPGTAGLAQALYILCKLNNLT
ncbi:tubulin-like doman-containing protein [Aetokthonos hydrillicola Thurmond2011]|jgi:hypothetical protein|uniref:Tubulin-like doman-containing protein n=1 Tax=Aetokthonos hydrillicola Thurmond2011 TaxID=2712845 RepID=A0AAP5IDY9_9CYAN|nr:hypothetical protein [Aetokthonos hydrillicola]MBO3463174.1 hypothetical protein [Aetokthonos hydrillicola CCALA 1050]MBW4584193.1 tubulin-like doman-containing protein [Aetokthonos hydrillicola CCALA 1050]MDR9898599.1 tubulin-like doman-containing protein [Aetokthonos hydrillicola Thurmond2011]